MLKKSPSRQGGSKDSPDFTNLKQMSRSKNESPSNGLDGKGFNGQVCEFDDGKKKIYGTAVNHDHGLQTEPAQESLKSEATPAAPFSS